MKNLLTRSALALCMFSLSLVSCNKEAPIPGALPPVATISSSTSWTPKGSEKPIVSNGDINNGDVNVSYTTTPTLAGPVCASGTWEVTVEGPAGAQYAMTYSAKTGKATFVPLTKGTYKLTFRYKCPGCADITITITITVS